MPRQIKRRDITMPDGQKAVLSTAELQPGLYETMLASPDMDIEYATLRSDNEGQALADFRNLRNKYNVEPLNGKYAKLAEDLREAAAYALDVAASKGDDGGTCNFDAVALDLPGWYQKRVERAAEAAGVGCFVWHLFGRHKLYVFPVRSGYQGNARTVVAEAMRDALRAYGYKTNVYYQMD